MPSISMSSSGMASACTPMALDGSSIAEIEYLPRRCNSLFNPIAVDAMELRIARNADVVVVPLIGNR